jgi:hypothetical protein
VKERVLFDDDADEDGRGDAYDAMLTAAREEAAELGWHILETLGGFAAVPLEAKIVSDDDLDGLIAKLWAHLPLSAREQTVPPLRIVAPAADRYREIGLVRPAPDDGVGSGG